MKEATPKSKTFEVQIIDNRVALVCIPCDHLAHHYEPDIYDHPEHRFPLVSDIIMMMGKHIRTTPHRHIPRDAHKEIVENITQV